MECGARDLCRMRRVAALGQELVDADGQNHAMAGLPHRARRELSLGYRTAQVQRDDRWYAKEVLRAMNFTAGSSVTVSAALRPGSWRGGREVQAEDGPTPPCTQVGSTSLGWTPRLPNG